MQTVARIGGPRAPAASTNLVRKSPTCAAPRLARTHACCEAQQPASSTSSTTSSMFARIGATTAAAALLLLSPVDARAAGGADFELPYNKPEVTKESSPRSLALAVRLRDAGAHMYGAFWCSHCFEQEQAFGKQAMGDFPYVECYSNGWRRGVQLDAACEAVPIRAFPTWVIGDQIIEGEMDFDALDAALDALEKTKAQ